VWRDEGFIEIVVEGEVLQIEVEDWV